MIMDGNGIDHVLNFFCTKCGERIENKYKMMSEYHSISKEKMLNLLNDEFWIKNNKQVSNFLKEVNLLPEGKYCIKRSYNERLAKSNYLTVTDTTHIKHIKVLEYTKYTDYDIIRYRIYDCPETSEIKANIRLMLKSK